MKKSYTLKVPDLLDSTLREVAQRHDTNVEDVIQRAIRLFLITDSLERDPDAALIVREGGIERELVLFATATPGAAEGEQGWPFGA